MNCGHDRNYVCETCKPNNQITQETAKELLDALIAYSKMFKCTQRPSDYPEDHHANKAIKAIAKAKKELGEE